MTEFEAKNTINIPGCRNRHSYVASGWFWFMRPQQERISTTRWGGCGIRSANHHENGTVQYWAESGQASAENTFYSRARKYGKVGY